MPVFPNRVPDLQHIGPIIEIIIQPPFNNNPHIKVGGTFTPPKIIMALIDTGASSTCIDESIAVELGLIARDVINVCTPAGVSQQKVYDIVVTLPKLQNVSIPVLSPGANLAAQPYRALIGRDILKHCTLIYNGWDNSYQLHI